MRVIYSPKQNFQQGEPPSEDCLVCLVMALRMALAWQTQMCIRLPIAILLHLPA